MSASSSPFSSRFLPPGGSPTTKGFTIRTISQPAQERPLSQSPIKTDVPWTAESEGTESAATIAVLHTVFGIGEAQLNDERAVEQTYRDAKALLAPDPPKKRATKKNPNPIQPQKYIPERARLEGVSLGVSSSMESLSLRDGHFDALMDGELLMGPLTTGPSKSASTEKGLRRDGNGSAHRPSPSHPAAVATHAPRFDKPLVGAISRGSNYSGSKPVSANQELDLPKEETRLEQKRAVSEQSVIAFSEARTAAAAVVDPSGSELQTVLNQFVSATISSGENGNASTITPLENLSASTPSTGEMASAPPAMVSGNRLLLNKFLDNPNSAKSGAAAAPKQKPLGNTGSAAEAVASGKWIAKKGSNGKKAPVSKNAKASVPRGRSSNGKRKVAVKTFGSFEAEVAGNCSADEDEDALEAPRSDDEGFVVDDSEEGGEGAEEEEESASSAGGEGDHVVGPDAEALDQEELDEIGANGNGHEEEGDAMNSLIKRHRREKRDKTLNNMKKMIAIERHKKRVELDIPDGVQIPDSDDSEDEGYVGTDDDDDDEVKIVKIGDVAVEEDNDIKEAKRRSLEQAPHVNDNKKPANVLTPKRKTAGSNERQQQQPERLHGQALASDERIERSPDPKHLPTLNPCTQEEVQFGNVMRLLLNAFLNEADGKNGTREPYPLMRILEKGAHGGSSNLTKHELRQFKLYCHYFGDVNMTRHLQAMARERSLESPAVNKSQSALADRILAAFERKGMIPADLAKFVRSGDLKFDAHENVFPMDYRCCKDHPLLDGAVDNDAPLNHCIITHDLLTADTGLSVTVNVPQKGLHVLGFVCAELGALLNAIQFSLSPAKQLYDSVWNFLLMKGYSPEQKPDGSGRPIVSPPFANVKQRELLRDQYIREVAPAFWHQYRTFRQSLAGLAVLLFAENPLDAAAAEEASAPAPAPEEPLNEETQSNLHKQMLSERRATWASRAEVVGTPQSPVLAESAPGALQSDAEGAAEDQNATGTANADPPAETASDTADASAAAATSNAGAAATEDPQQQQEPATNASQEEEAAAAAPAEEPHANEQEQQEADKMVVTASGEDSAAPEAPAAEEGGAQEAEEGEDAAAQEVPAAAAAAEEEGAAAEGMETEQPAVESQGENATTPAEGGANAEDGMNVEASQAPGQ